MHNHTDPKLRCKTLLILLTLASLFLLSQSPALAAANADELLQVSAEEPAGFFQQQLTVINYYVIVLGLVALIILGILGCLVYARDKKLKTQLEEMQKIKCKAEEDLNATLQDFKENMLELHKEELAENHDVFQEKVRLLDEKLGAYETKIEALHCYNLGLIRLSEKDYAKAAKSFELAATTDTTSKRYLNCWGNSLTSLAHAATDPEQSEHLAQQANEKYEKATELDATYATAWQNWGLALDLLAELATVPETKFCLLLDATEKYKTAVLHNPDYALAFYSWGNALEKLAGLAETPEEQEQFRSRAAEKFQKAEELA